MAFKSASTKGIIAHLGEKSGSGLPGLVTMISSSPSRHPGNVKMMLYPNGQSGDGGACSMKKNFFEFTFLAHTIEPTHYAFAHVSCQAPTDWKLFGYNKAGEEILLHHAQGETMPGQHQQRAWPVHFVSENGPFSRYAPVRTEHLPLTSSDFM
jgi:hypothetical protein